ncbi:hypothetical protein BS17DRAFT_882814, partial [Gyrodon lividus]
SLRGYQPVDLLRLYAILGLETGLLRITESQYANLKPLTFNIIRGVACDLTLNAQIWPRSLNIAIGHSSGSICLIVSDIGTPSG